MCQVIIAGSSTLQDAIDFLLYLLIYLGMLAEQIPRPGQSGSGCFMPRAKESQALSHQLLIAHGFPIFVSCLQQDREKIIALCLVTASLINEALNIVT